MRNYLPGPPGSAPECTSCHTWCTPSPRPRPVSRSTRVSASRHLAWWAGSSRRHRMLAATPAPDGGREEGQQGSDERVGQHTHQKAAVHAAAASQCSSRARACVGMHTSARLPGSVQHGSALQGLTCGQLPVGRGTIEVRPAPACKRQVHTLQGRKRRGSVGQHAQAVAAGLLSCSWIPQACDGCMAAAQCKPQRHEPLWRIWCALARRGGAPAAGCLPRRPPGRS